MRCGCISNPKRGDSIVRPPSKWVSVALVVSTLAAVASLAMGTLGLTGTLNFFGNTTSIALISGGGLLVIISIITLTWRCRKNPTDQIYVRALHQAAEKNKTELIKALLEFGTPVDGVEMKWMTLFDEITPQKMGGKTIEEKLEEIGNLAEAAQQRRWDSVRLTPLHKASIYGSYEAAQLLLGNGADPNARDTFGQTPLEKTTDQKITALLSRYQRD